MDTSSETIGKELRRIFAAQRRPMGWSVIDAFARLEEREEARRDGDESNDGHRPNRDARKDAR
jgi:hypothetical protein